MTLYLEKRGMDFYRPADSWCKGHREDRSDVGNYRVGVYDYSVPGKDGSHYTLEFGFANGLRWTDKKGKKLSKPIRDPEAADRLYIQTYCLDEENICWGNYILDKEVNDIHLPYSLEGILAAANYICGEEIYTEIEFAERS